MSDDPIAAAQKTIDAYDTLIARAREIAGNAPHFTYIRDESIAWIEIEDGTATLRWNEAESEYDSWSLTTKEFAFPAELLFLSDDEFNAWKKEQRRFYERQQADRAAAEMSARETAERTEFERLKAKYGAIV